MEEDILTRTFCVEFTDFPDVDEAWLEDKANAIRRDLVSRLGRKLEWGQVVTMPERHGIGVALLLARGCEQDRTLAESVHGVICRHVGIVMPKSGRGKAKRKGGLPRVGLGPRFPAEFYESHGRFRGVSPVIHSEHGKGKRAGTEESGRQSA